MTTVDERADGEHLDAAERERDPEQLLTLTALPTCQLETRQATQGFGADDFLTQPSSGYEPPKRERERERERETVDERADREHLDAADRERDPEQVVRHPVVRRVVDVPDLEFSI